MLAKLSAVKQLTIRNTNRVFCLSCEAFSIDHQKTYSVALHIYHPVCGLMNVYYYRPGSVIEISSALTS